MCGIVGAFGPSATTLAGHLDYALHTIAHRGPDATGKYHSPDSLCIFGHKRLTIVDLDPRSNQPLIRGENVIAYNGEIYNHEAIRSQLPHWSYTTTSDTETLLALLSQPQWNLENLEGMFIAAFYNERKHELILIRDSLGIKPLYYLQLPDSTIVFGSELKALFALAPEWPVRASWKSLAQYITFENYPQGEGLFEGTKLLLPGEVLRCTVDSHHHISISSAIYSYASCRQGPEKCLPVTTEAEALVKSSVHKHLMSDVPLGVYLSGGIDSSLVAAFAAKEREDLIAFTGWFPSESSYYDERPLASAVATHLNLPLVEVPIGPEDFSRTFDNLVYALDEPRMGMGSFSQYCVARVAARERKVILSGHGGDELFAGYPQFKAFLALDRKWPLRDRLFSVMSYRAKEWPWLINSIGQRLRGRNITFAPEIFRPNSTLLRDVANNKGFHPLTTHNLISGLERYYRQVYLPGLLTVEDKVSMAHSLETRMPLWSQEIVEWATESVTLLEKLRGGSLKSILKDVARRHLPASVVRAPKRGFPTPLRRWFRDELYDFIAHRLLDSPNPFLSAILPRRDREQLLKSHRTRPLPFALDELRAHKLWILLSLESWSRQFKIVDISIPEISPSLAQDDFRAAHGI